MGGLKFRAMKRLKSKLSTAFILKDIFRENCPSMYLTNSGDKKEGKKSHSAVQKKSHIFTGFDTQQC